MKRNKSCAIKINVTDEETSLIIEAMKHWENCTCVRFRERTSEDQYYIVIMKGRIGE